MFERQIKFSKQRKLALIPFLNLSRSLGDFWSYNPRTNKFAVSPTPDVHVHPLNPKVQKFIVIASDGLWNVMSPHEVVLFIWDYECNEDECHQPRDVVRAIMDEALRRWNQKKLQADNIAVLIAFLTEVSMDERIDSTSKEDGIGLETMSELISNKPPVSPSLPPTSAELSSDPVAPKAHHLQRSPLKGGFSKPPIRKHGRVEENLVESMPLLKRSKLEVLDGVCGDNLFQPHI